MRTTVALKPRTRDRLLELKRTWHLASVDEVIDRLVGGAPLGARALYQAHREAVEAALTKYGVRRLVAFGSRARGDARPDSDLDLVAELPPGTSLFDVGGLQEELCDAFGLVVNVMTPEALDERMQRIIAREGVVLFG